MVTLNCSAEPFKGDWFNKIMDCKKIKSLKRVLLVGSGKNYFKRFSLQAV